MLTRLREADRQQLTTLLDQLPSPARGFVEQSLNAAATSDVRLLPGVLPLIGPTLRLLPAESCVTILERVAQLAQVFPAGVVPLFRSLSRVFDEGGEQRTLEWITVGESVGKRNAEAGLAFFALRSRTSILALRGVPAVVYLGDIQGVLLKFLHMLSGAVVGLTETERISIPPPLAIELEDEALIPLPYCIERFATYEENFRLYRVLVAHHAARLEFGTYTCSPLALWSTLEPLAQSLNRSKISAPDDIVDFFKLFPRPDLMESMFLAVEGKRIVPHLVARYPGLQSDFAWAETLLGLSRPEIVVILSQMPDSVWTELAATGTVSDSLQLATKLYMEFLRDEQSLLMARDNSRFQNTGFDDEDRAGFLTGSEIEGEKAKEEPADEPQVIQRQKALTTADLRYLYDEWDFEIEDYRPHWCELREIAVDSDEGGFFSRTVMTHADLIRSIKRDFQRLRPRMHHQVKGLEDGEDIDLNATVNARVDHLLGNSPTTKVYTARQFIERDVAVLFLLDVSASTAGQQVNDPNTPQPANTQQNGPPIIDVVKEAVTLLSVALEEIGDTYAIYGFSSNGRYDVEVYPVKTFRDPLSVEVQGRIGGLTSRGGTRMGTAIRHAIRMMKEISSRTKLLVLLSDGYPEDAGYGKPVTPPTYGLRDTAMALREAERSGITPFCLTVDKGGHDYLREMCASSRYMVIEDLLSLPRELPKIYQRHIRGQRI
jgi:hypothetical protein